MKTSRSAIFLSFVLFFTYMNVAQSQVLTDTVQVTSAGTLSTLIPAADKLTLTDLKVTGQINGNDLLFLKQTILGNGSGKLTFIDLTESKIKSGGSSINTIENQFPSSAFDGCTQLKSIMLPSSITTIGNNAFGDCLGLKSIFIPDSVTTIGEYAFTNCSTLVSVKFPKKLKTIGSYAFSNCVVLDTVNLPEGTTSLGHRSFWTCLGVKSVTLPQTITTIGDGTFFMWRQIQTIVIPDNVTALGDYMFTSCYKLETVHLPAKLTRLGTEALFACKILKTINWPTGLKSIGDHAFKYCFELTDVQLPEGLTSIGIGAFERDFKIKKIVLPNSLLSLSNDVFMDCNMLDSVQLPSGLVTIPSNAFKSCYQLKSIDLPTSVKTIGSFAFGSCKLMKEIKLPASLTSISSNAFDSIMFETINCEGSLPATLSSTSFFPVIKSTCKVYVPHGSLAVYKAASYWKDFLSIGYVTTTIYLSIKLADNGYLKQKVAMDSVFTCFLVANDGWKINTVLLNDMDVTASVDSSGLFTTPALTMNSTLNVSFERALASNTLGMKSLVKVYTEENSIVVKGAELGTKVSVYSLSGRLLHAVMVNSDLERIPVAADQVYLIRTNDKLYKLAL